MKIVFLYTELAEYTIACLKALTRAHSDVKIKVIHFPVNKEAPFQFDLRNIGEFTSIDAVPDYTSFKREIVDFCPDKILCCGWVNKWYLRICFDLRKRSVCILAMDNHWIGSIRQRVFAVFAKLLFKKIFCRIWIPGDVQLKYAQKLGFNGGRIMTGFYCSDVWRFESFFQSSKSAKKENFPHRMLCVARYNVVKGYPMLWDAFVEWKERYPNDWELWCAGTGDLYNTRRLHPAIKHLGFVQSAEWHDIIEKTGVFVLSSIFEPWGVVVQEFAAAGYPLLLSNCVGARDAFLTSGNGTVYDSDNKEALINSFQKICSATDESLFSMGLESNRLAHGYLPEDWAFKLLNA